VDFVVIDYNEKAFDEATNMGIKAIYGDASDSDIIKEVNIKESKCVIVAIPDRAAQEELVTQIQTISPRVKIFARAHFDSDAARLRFLRVNKVVQPEFEAALEIVRAVLITLGKSDSEVKEKIRSLRRSHTALENSLLLAIRKRMTLSARRSIKEKKPLNWRLILLFLVVLAVILILVGLGKEREEKVLILVPGEEKVSFGFF